MFDVQIGRKALNMEKWPYPIRRIPSTFHPSKSLRVREGKIGRITTKGTYVPREQR